MRRREFLHVIGMAGAAATVGGCARGGGPEKLIPYLIPPEDGAEPGVNAEYATVCRECPAGCGMAARVRDGRAHKLEGNPDHPVNRGKLCLRGQAALQGLYNPDRHSQPMVRDAYGRLQAASWKEVEGRFWDALTRAGAGHFAWIGQVETGAFDRLVDRWLAVVAPTHTRIRYEAFAYEPLRAAHARVFGRPGIPQLRIDQARMLLSFGADFLETWISNVEYTRQFSAWRQKRQAGQHRGRYVFIAPRLSLTGQNADEWIAIRPGTEALVAQALFQVVEAVRGKRPIPGQLIAPAAEAAGVKPETLERIGREFAASSSPLALPLGNEGYQESAVGANETILRLNALAGSRALIPGWPHALEKASTHRELMDLLAAMQGGQVALLVIHGANPAYHLPPSSGFAEAIKQVPMVVSFSSYPDETTGQVGQTGGFAHLVLPDHTPLESWGEYSPRPGITGLIQPVVAPVFDTRPTGDLLLASASHLGHNLGAATFQEYLRKAHPMDDTAWMAALQRGGHFTIAEESGPGTAGAGETGSVMIRPPIGFATSVFSGPAAGMARVTPTPEPSVFPATAPANLSEGDLVLQVYPSLHFYDGRLANRPWAQEIPHPTTKAVWGSWAEIHPETASKLGAKNGTVLVLQTDHGKLEVPALISEGVHRNLIAVELGQGHHFAGRYANAVGVNPLQLLGPGLDTVSGGPLRTGVPIAVQSVEKSTPVVVLQTNYGQNDTKMARSVSITDLTKEQPKVFKEPEEPSLYSTMPPRQHPRTRHKWGMVIDLDRCVGCNACAAACYAENNVPVVGKTECANGREMSWLRIETYSEAGMGKDTDPAATNLDLQFLPMLCQQCDNAPCEYVCPVNATMHNDEGLNVQVYNRCVGTRFCSNNCPYKVRRFNWYTFPFPAPLDQQLNPDVIHRKKGVMEKCTFCIQRIRRHEIDALAEGRPIPDGEIQTACMQSCPADAIIFGDQEDPQSVVHQHFSRENRGYGALEQLNTFPNIQYLKRIRVEEGEG